MRSYEAARSLFSFLAFVAWMVIIAGVLIALIGAKGASIYGGSGAGLVAAMPGIGIAMMGFIQLAFVQIGRAGVDTAEYTQQMLKISREQLEVSQQSLKQGKRFEAGFAALEQSASEKHKSSFSGQVGKIEKPQMAEDIKVPVAALAAIAKAEVEPEIPDATAPQTPQLEEMHSTPLPEPAIAQAMEPAPKRPEPMLLRELKDNETRYAGRIIREENGQFMFARMSFNSLPSAQRYIDQLGVNPNTKHVL